MLSVKCLYYSCTVNVEKARAALATKCDELANQQKNLQLENTRLAAVVTDQCAVDSRAVGRAAQGERSGCYETPEAALSPADEVWSGEALW